MSYSAAENIKTIIEKFETALSAVEFNGIALSKVNSAHSLKWDSKNKNKAAFSVYLDGNEVFEGDEREYLPVRNEGIIIKSALIIEVSLNLSINAGAAASKDNISFIEESVIPAIYTCKRGGANALSVTSSFKIIRYNSSLTNNSGEEIFRIELALNRRLSMS